MSRSRRVVPDELVTLMSWDLMISLVKVGWKGKDAVKDGVVAFSCLLNCLRVSLLGFSSFLFDTVHDAFDSVRGCAFCKEVV